MFFASIVFFAFFVKNKSFVWGRDALYQHYNAFVYYGKWLRGIVRTLFFEHRLEAPLWEFSIGYGGDVIHTLSYYVIGDPFALLSVFFPAAYAEIGYGAVLLLRFYAAGIAFCAYSRKMGAGTFAALSSSMMYLFCSYSCIAIRHPYFINPMFYLPLLLLGVEKIMKKERPYCYVVAVFLTAVSNFYFFYMIVLLTILYVAVRLLCDPQQRCWKNLLQSFGKFFGFAIVGVMMASVLFLPVVVNFLSDKRISDAYQYHFLYYRSQYEMLVGSFVGVKEACSWCYAGLAPLVFLGVGAILMERGKRYLWLKLYMAFLVSFMLLPVMGYAFNGFGYVTNRWIFGWVLAAALSFALGWPLLLCMERKKKRILTCAVGIYTLLCLALPKARSLDVLYGCAFLIAFLILIFAYDWIERFFQKHAPSCRTIGFQFLTLGMMAVCIFGQCWGRYVSLKYVNEFVDRGMVSKKLNEDRAKYWDEIEDDSFYRIDNTMVKNAQANFALGNGQSTTAMLWSLVNPNIVEYLQANNAYQGKINSLRGLSSRSYLLPPACAKYYVTGEKKSQKRTVPFPFEVLQKDDSSGAVHESTASLPFGYTFDSVLSVEDFERMTAVQRQQAMLQAAVIQPEDMDEVSLLPEEEPVYNDQTLPCTIKCGKGVSISGNTITTTKKDAKITLKFDCPKNCELYVQLMGLSFESTCPYGDDDAELSSEEQRKKTYWRPATETDLIAECKGITSAVTHYTPYNIYAHGREDYLINLYFSDSERTKATLTFEQMGVYTFDELTLTAQPMDRLKGQVDALRQDTLQNVAIGTNCVTGEIALEQDKLLCLSLPYAKGWRITVDGQEAELLRTNVMYSGVMLSAGKHRIALYYRTPYLMVGSIVTLLGFAILFLIRCKINQLREARKCSRIFQAIKSLKEQVFGVSQPSEICQERGKDESYDTEGNRF